MQAQRAGANGQREAVAEASRAAFISLLAVVGPEPASYLLRTARQRTAGIGEMLVVEEQTDQAGVLIDGMLRTVVSLPDGRAATIHLTKQVQFFGLPTVFYPMRLSVHVQKKATVIELQGEEVRRCAREFPDFAELLTRQLAAAVGRVPSIIQDFGFKTVRQRIASHLISLSELENPTG